MAREAQPVQAQQVQAELEAAQEAAFEHARLTGRLVTAQSALAAAETQLALATEALAGEAADVQKLEDFSPTLIWATMRGNRDERLEAERAEHRAADESLRALSRELGDLGRDGVGGIEVGDLVGAFDVWLDDIFSDWTVMNRISEARDRVREALGAVGHVHEGAAERAAALEARLAELDTRRERLLTGG